MILPSGAIEDVRKLLELTPEQLTKLSELFSTPESAESLRVTFIETVATTLSLDLETARSVTVVCHFLLRSAYENRSGVRSAYENRSGVEMAKALRSYVGVLAKDSSELTAVLAQFDSKQEQIEDLLAYKKDRARAQKIRRLMKGPEPNIEDIRTICQLRPLFEGSEHEEKIGGLVPTILLEIEVTDADDSNQVFSFSVEPELLDHLQAVIERTKEKLDTIRSKYGDELLG